MMISGFVPHTMESSFIIQRLFCVGHVKEYHTMYYFENSRHTPLMISIHNCTLGML